MPERPRDRAPDDQPPEPSLPVRLSAEALGAFLLTFVAVGGDAAGVITGGKVDELARAVAPGLLVMAFIYAMGDRSGAHLNPAVTVAFTLRGLFPVALAPAYVLAQFAGALAAAGTVGLLLGDAVAAGVTKPHGIEPGVAVAIEVLLTGILVTVIIGTADRYRVVGPNAAMAVGATIALCGLIALPLEGASMNPARSTAPAVVAADLGDLWIYWVGPLVGAVVAVVLARLLHGPAPTDEKAVEAATGSDRERAAAN